MQQHFDAIVIGAGIVGVSTALHLLKRGKKTLLIDRRGPGEETSYGNAGVLGNCYVLPFNFPPLSKTIRILADKDTAARVHYKDLPKLLPWIADFYFNSFQAPRLKSAQALWPLLKNSIAEHREWAQKSGATSYFSAQGRAAIYRTKESYAADRLERFLARDYGLTYNDMSATEFSEIEPHLKPIYYRAVSWPTSQRVTNPGAVTAHYAEYFAKEGGTFLQANVSNLKYMIDKWHIALSGAVIEAPEIILCAGPWSTDFTKSLGYHFPMACKRGYHQHFAALNNATLAHSISDVDCGYVLGSMEQGFRITTGVEFADRDAPATPVQIGRALKKAQELFPLGEAIEPKAWLGSRPCFTDSLPIIGPAPRHKGLWFNFGHGHIGLTVGPTSGRLLAEMMVGAVPFCDPFPYRADRFSC